MKKKTLHTLLIAALVFACWLQFPVGLHPKKSIPGVAATCVDTGLTEGKACMLCGKAMVAQQVIPATGLHIYDNDFDVSCNNCSYTREVSSKLDFADHRVVLDDQNTDHKNWRVIVYRLGDQRVEDPTNEEALGAIDSDAKTYWGITEINRITLTDAGNYVVLLKYNIGANVTIKVPMDLTIDNAPKLIVDGDNRITVVDQDAENKDHTLTVYYLGETATVDMTDEAAVKQAAISTDVYTDISVMNETTITRGGNYAFYLRYVAADGTEQAITLWKTLKARPALRMDAENRLVASCDDETIINFRAFVYYLGEQTAADIYDAAALEDMAGDPVAYWGLKKINSAKLSEPGIYVIHLHYNVGIGPKETIALKVTI